MATTPDYDKTQWIDDSAPAINATNLNHIEQGIENATKGVQDLENSKYVLPGATYEALGGVRVRLTQSPEGNTLELWNT